MISLLHFCDLCHHCRCAAAAPVVSWLQFCDLGHHCRGPGVFLATLIRSRVPLASTGFYGKMTTNAKMAANLLADFVRSAKLNDKIYTCVLYEAGGVSLIRLSSVTAAQLHRGHGSSISMMSYRLTNNASYLISLTCLGGQSY